MLGAVLRTKDRTKPVFVSVGHKMELSQALDILLHCHHGYRIPEPTRLADQYVGTMRRTQGRMCEEGMEGLPGMTRRKRLLPRCSSACHCCVTGIRCRESQPSPDLPTSTPSTTYDWQHR